MLENLVPAVVAPKMGVRSSDTPVNAKLIIDFFNETRQPLYYAGGKDSGGGGGGGGGTSGCCASGTHDNIGIGVGGGRGSGGRGSGGSVRR